MKAILILSLAFFSAFSFADEAYRAQDVRHMIEVLGLDGHQSDETVLQIANEKMAAKGTLSCRGDGFSCSRSIECCTYCMSGVCGGATYNKPDGASCQSSIECQSYCLSGVCGGESFHKPDGAECQSSIECETYCLHGRCGGV